MLSVHQGLLRRASVTAAAPITQVKGRSTAVQSHESYMQRALELAARGSGCTSPNPLVGCVIVRDGVVIGEGWHENYGHAHSEVNALLAASRHALTALPLRAHGGTKPDVVSGRASASAGATMYVTLEPCHHHGLTPPCTQALMAAGIAHVIYALADPNPRAAGGANWLQAQGVKVTMGFLEKEARCQNRFFLKQVMKRQPYVIAKSATSLDGRIATRTGDSQWITGEAARQRGHELRQAVDAIIVGADTVIADDPSLTVRLPESVLPATCIRHPRPVVLDSTGRVPLSARLLDGSLQTRTIVITTERMPVAHRRTLESRGIDVVVVQDGPQGAGTDPAAVLAALGQRSLQSVLIEGGATVQGTFRDAGLIDELWSFMAPTLIGGREAPAAFAALGSNSLQDATMLSDIHVEAVGQDLLVRARILPVGEAAEQSAPVISHKHKQLPRVD